MKNWNPHNIKDSLTGETLGYVENFTNFKLSLYKNLLKKFELLENTISIIIQGPLHARSISTIENYLQYGEVIVSCWDNDDFSMLEEYKDKITIVKNKYSDIKKYTIATCRNARPYILQNYTTRNGLAVAKGFLSIKVRSDESFPVLDPLINILKNNRDSKNNSHKVTTSNIYFRYDKESKFHPSDHIIAGSTSRLKLVFEKCMMNCFCKKNLSLTPEQLIATSAIESFFNPLLRRFEIANIENSIELMKKHFDIIRVKDLPGAVWTSSYRKYRPLTSEEDWCHNIDSIGLKG